MDNPTIQYLNNLNRAFYAVTAAEFDQTRGRAWQGWEMLLPYLQTPLSVLDVGCGNGRFGAFLSDSLAGSIQYHGLDLSPELLAYAHGTLSGRDALQVLLEEHDLLRDPLPSGQYNLVVLFGVIHHIPGAENRRTLLRNLAQCVAPNGLLCFASWRFYEYERFRERIVPWEACWQVEANDYLLDWRRGERALRYCHYVDDDEQAALAAASGLEMIQTWRADGSDHTLNCYSLLQRRGKE